MAVLNVVLYWALVYAGAGQRKQDSASEGERACAIAVARLQERILGYRVMAPAVGVTAPSLSYMVASRDADGNFEVGPGGEPVWVGPLQLSTQLEPSTQEVLLTGPSDQNSAESQLLARLGPQGRVMFSRVSEKLLDVVVEAAHDHDVETTRSYRSRARVRIYLQNQEP